MPNNYTTPHTPRIEEDEIDLRELFRTIGRYKWSIFFITMLITIIVAAYAYRMPKYYKTTTVIEVKQKSGESRGLSLGSAGALLGLGGNVGGGSSINKDAALLTMYHTNESILKQKLYSVQFYHYQKFRYTELSDTNCSLSISAIHIPNYKKYGIEILFQPLTETKFALSVPSLLADELLGEYTYDTPIHTEYFSLVIHKNSKGITPYKIKLNANTHYIFDTLISKNLTANADKDNPFIAITLLDTIPDRAETYIKQLLQHYINLSVGLEIEDINISLNSLNQQIRDIEKKVQKGANNLEQFKVQTEIISPKEQIAILIKSLATLTDKLTQNRYQISLIKQLIQFVRKNKNIDAIAPSLIELQDTPTTALISKLQSLQLNATALSQEFKSTYPKLKSIRKQIKSIKSKIRSNLKNLQKTLKSKRRTLLALKKEYESKIKKTPKAEQKMRILQRDYSLNEKLYTYLLQKRATTKLKLAEALNRFRTVESIYTKPSPVKPKKALIVIVGFITALLFSIFLAFFREFLRKE